MMSQATPEQLELAWNRLQALAPISIIRTEEQYDQALETLNLLIETVGEDETHPLFDLLDTLSLLIHAYEESAIPMGNASGADVLKFFMEEHQLSAAQLPELGTAAEVDDILAGRRALTATQIQTLAQRFGVTPATFA